ncbi:MAG: VOC family protein, partial [Acidobacteriales bacterium]|nr:VOC family protein [Terriglobales bacterium]
CWRGDQESLCSHRYRAAAPHLSERFRCARLADQGFGLTEHYRYGEPHRPISGAQVYLGSAYIMLKSARSGGASPAQLGHRTQYLTVFVNDVDTHYQRTKSAGARIVEELNETCYGERQYRVEDLEGHYWLFSRQEYS